MRLSFLVLLLALLGSPDQAAGASFVIAGTVATVVEDGRLPVSIQPGDAFIGEFSYATNAAGVEQFPGLFVADDAPGRISVSVNGLTFESTNGIGQLSVANDAIFLGGTDRLQFGVDPVDSNGLGGDFHRLSVGLIDSTGTALQGLNPPAVLDLADFDTAEVTWQIAEQPGGPQTEVFVPVRIIFTIDTLIVSEAPLAWLVSLALLGASRITSAQR